LKFEAVSKFLNFSAHNYTRKAIIESKHNEDLFDMNTTFLSIDGFMMGTGSNSCGPKTTKEYRLNAKYGSIYRYSYKITAL